MLEGFENFQSGLHTGQAGASTFDLNLALERLYQASLTKWAMLQPDVHFIIHPGGQYPDAVVGTLDLTLQP